MRIIVGLTSPTAGTVTVVAHRYRDLPTPGRAAFDRRSAGEFEIACRVLLHLTPQAQRPHVDPQLGTILTSGQLSRTARTSWIPAGLRSSAITTTTLRGMTG
jgi:hypothetical protein